MFLSALIFFEKVNFCLISFDKTVFFIVSLFERAQMVILFQVLRGVFYFSTLLLGVFLVR